VLHNATRAYLVWEINFQGFDPNVLRACHGDGGGSGEAFFFREGYATARMTIEEMLCKIFVPERTISVYGSAVSLKDKFMWFRMENKERPFIGRFNLFGY
jgi:hypothetical protein